MAPPQGGDEGDTAPLERVRSSAGGERGRRERPRSQGRSRSTATSEVGRQASETTTGGDEEDLFSVGERTILVVRPHIAKLGGIATRTLIAVIVALVLDSRVGPADDILFAIALFFLARLGWQVLEYVNDRFVITDRRIFRLSGILTRTVASMPVGKLTDLIYERSIPGRLLGYGTLIVETAGQDQALSTISYLPKPDIVYRTISQQVFTAPDQ